MTRHYAGKNSTRAICGANQGNKMFARVKLTTDAALVTCKSCRKQLDGRDAQPTHPELAAAEHAMPADVLATKPAADAFAPYTDAQGHLHAFCACSHDCSTHPDAAHPLDYCADCGKPTCDECRDYVANDGANCAAVCAACLRARVAKHDPSKPDAGDMGDADGVPARVDAVDCRVCGGAGYLATEPSPAPCRYCNGTGKALAITAARRAQRAAELDEPEPTPVDELDQQLVRDPMPQSEAAWTRAERAVGQMQLVQTDLLAAAARGELDLNRIARIELASRGLDWQGKWVGFERAKFLSTCCPVRRADGRVVPVSIPSNGGAR